MDDYSYIYPAKSRHPRIAARIQLATRAAGRGDFSSVSPGRLLCEPYRQVLTHRGYRRPAEEEELLLLRASLEVLCVREES